MQKMSHKLMVAITFIAIIAAVSSVTAQTQHLSVKWNRQQRNYQVVVPKVSKDGVVENEDSVAWGSYDNAINKTGWAYLEVYTNASYDDTQQAYSAGLLEGYLTRDLIQLQWQNTFQNYCSKPFTHYCHRLQRYLDKNMAWVSEQITSQAEKDPYWHHVELFLEQMSGMADGYLSTPRFPSMFSMDVTTITLFQIAGDLEDLEAALNKSKHNVLGSGSCSSLIKLLPGNQDLYVAQDTWNSYNSMLRILKKYDFRFRTTGEAKEDIPAPVMTFSSYPGCIISGDDFYIMNTGLVAIETTIGNSNPALWSYIGPTYSVLEGIRNIVSNRLAVTADDWVNSFIRYNSGTYNNDWMIVDYKKFKPGQPLPDYGLLYVVETLPDIYVQQDVTSVFKQQTYWPSYNIPYFKDIFNAGGSAESVKTYGDWFSYENSPRAKIFRRDHVKVKDIQSMTRLMRYNNFTHDPLSRCNCTPPYSAENAISARSDLNQADGKYPFSALGLRPHGGIDMKLTNSSMVKNLEFIAVSSPTYDNIPIFQWSKAPFRATVPHAGQPDVWDFKPVQHKWTQRT